MDRSRRLTLIPAFNESGTISSVVKSVLKYSDVLVVDDSSSDETALYAEKAGARVVSHKTNKGYEGALNTGFQYAQENGFSFVLTFDADGQHDVKMIDQFFMPLETEGVSLVLGKRPEYARFSEKLFGCYFKFRFGLHDPLCGMKSYNLDVYKDYGFFDTIGSIGSELLLVAAKSRDWVVKEVDVPIFCRADEPRFGSLFRSNLIIFKALIRIFFLDVKL